MDVYNAWDKVTVKSLNSIPQAGDTEHLNLSRSDRMVKSPKISLSNKKKLRKQEFLKSKISKVLLSIYYLE